MLEDAEDLAKRGVQLSPREVVRLNAFGLRAERGTVSTALFSIRRACICHDMVLHEPTIGHHVWLAEAERVLDLADGETWCYTRAYWLSHINAADLAPVGLPRVLEAVVKDWARRHLADLTLRELRAAMAYAENGATDTDGEDGPRGSTETDAAAPAVGDDWCSELAVVHEAQSMGLGIKLADAMTMTRAQLRAVIDRALRVQGIMDSKTARLDAVGDYQRVLAEIMEEHGIKG